jgi:hypothetical protein
MKRADMVRQGAELFFQAETSLEKTLSEIMFFGHQLGQMRMDSNLSMVIGQDQFSRVGKLISLLTDARGEMVDLHGSLNDLKAQLGCRTVALGTNEDKFGPNEHPEDTGMVHTFPVVGERTAA